VAWFIFGVGIGVAASKWRRNEAAERHQENSENGQHIRMVASMAAAWRAASLALNINGTWREFGQ